ncbi:MAG: response regulator, partial [candidate division KSB1 bacterium]|nr:response regulator [candidate division KSB1 bacterium]
GIYRKTDSLWLPIENIPKDSLTIFHDLLPLGRDSLWIAADYGAVLLGSGSMLLITENGPATITSTKPPTDRNAFANVYQIYQDRQDNLWLVRSGYDKELLLIPNWKKNLFQPKRWSFFPTRAKGCPLGLRPNIFQASDGSYWITSYSEESGIYHFKHLLSLWQYYDLTALGGNNVVLSVVETSDGILWFGGNGCLYAFQKGRMHFYPQEELRLPISSLQLLQAQDGSLWLAGVNASVFSIDYGRKYFDGFQELHFQGTAKEHGNIFLSREGRLVLAEQGSYGFRSYGVEDGLPAAPTAVLIDREGTLWIYGSHNGIAAVARFNKDHGEMDLFPDLSWSISASAAAQDSSGRLWFGSMGDPAGNFRGGFVVYEPVGNGYRKRRIILDNDTYNRINCIVVAVDGSLWAGGSYLMRCDSTDWKPIIEPKELQRGWFDHLLAASDGGIWAAKGGGGVYRCLRGAWAKSTRENGLAGVMVSCLLETKDGILAATETGISWFDGRSWTTYALPEQIVVPRESGSLRLDHEGRVWINLAPRDWYFRALKPNRSIKNGRFLCISYCKDHSPPQADFSVYPYRLIMPASPYIAWYGRDPWSVTAEKDLTYSYRLNDGPWSAFTSVTSVRLPDLPSGSYTFEVRARDRDGNIQAEPKQIKFYVVPPVWRQPWFAALISFFTLLILSLLGILSLKNQKLALANREIEQASAFKERFYMNLSHELRTPLTVILAVLAKAENLTGEELKQPMTVIRRHADYLRRLVNQLLEFRRMESGSVRLQVSAGDLVGTVKETMQLFDWLAGEHRLLFTLLCTENSLPAWFDHSKVETILINLISNAFKYTPEGGRVTVALRRVRLSDNNPVSSRRLKSKQTEPVEWAEIVVADTGIGIPQDRLEHIFERFYTVEHPGRLYYDSIGVGLDLTREIVELHKGTIQVHSIEQQGSTFTVRIPIDRRAFAADEIVEQRPIGPQQLSPELMEEIERERAALMISADRRQTLKEPAASILIVEDHPDLRRLLSDLLRPYFKVTEIDNGRAAFTQAVETVPDLIVSDVMMPEMDGIEATRSLKRHPATNHIPVVLLTVRREIEHRVEGYETGADAYLTKPFEPEELMAVIDTLLENRKKLQQKFRQEIVIKPTDVTIHESEKVFLEKCLQVVESHLDDPDFHIDRFCREIG